MRLSVVDLACRRGGRDVFAGVSFAVSGGEALIVRGRNGAGKSSLLRTLIGLLRPAAGRITLEGGDAELSLAEQAHYLGHQDALKPALTVGENLRFWAAYLGRAERAKQPGSVAEALETVGLRALADLPAAYLSAGQRRRLSVARLLAVKRPIWLLDEPTSTLDAAAQDRLAGRMQAHLADGGLIVAATHGPIGLSATRELRLDYSSPSLAAEDRADGPESGAQTAAPALAATRPIAGPSPRPGGEP